MNFPLFLSLITISAIGLTVDANGDAKFQKRAIVNGYDAPDRPFYVLIEIEEGYEGFMCGGTIIGPQHVLSAAHCFAKKGNLT